MKLHLNIATIIISIVISSCTHATSIQQDTSWKIGAKIHFEDESSDSHIGVREVNQITRDILKSTLGITRDLCADNAKVLLTRDDGEIVISHYTERMNPTVGEEMHSTLLYTRPRGYCDSETLEQVCTHLFQDCTTPKSLEEIANVYGAIVTAKQRFAISEVTVEKRNAGATFTASLLFEGKPYIHLDGNPISAGLHMTLIQCFEGEILDEASITKILSLLNSQLKGKLLKVGLRNGVTDLELGISGTAWRLRAGQRIDFNNPKQLR